MELRFRKSHQQGHADYLTIENPRLVLAGYAGRDQAAVSAHIQELLKEGVQAPEITPTYYFPPVDLLTFPATHLAVASAHTSGEIEPVIIVDQGHRWVTLGSDHTDRKEEQRSVDYAKTLGPKVIADEVWDWDEVSDHWDQLHLSAVLDHSPYQKGLTASLLPPDAHPLISAPPDRQPLILFLGTVPTLEGMAFGETFAGQLFDPVLHRSISLAYSVKEVPRG